MSCITIAELVPVGAQLFHDSESFLDELSAQDLNEITGGLSGWLKSLTLSGISRSLIRTQFKSKVIKSAGPIGYTYTYKTYFGG